MNESKKTPLSSELLILPDGRILAHNITIEMAAVLTELDPDNAALKQRARSLERLSNYESPDRN